MIKVTTEDGEEFFGDTHAEIVKQLRNTVWGERQGKRDYMVEAADRASSMTGQDVTGDRGAEQFLRGLQQAGLIQLTESEEQ